MVDNIWKLYLDEGEFISPLFYASKYFVKPNIREISINMYVGNTLKKISKVEMEIIKIKLINVYFV